MTQTRSKLGVVSSTGVVLLMLAAGCGFHEVQAPPRPSGIPEELRNRAAYDFGCAAEKVVGRSFGESTTLVRGCGREAIYLESCESCVPVVEDRTIGLGALPPVANYPCHCTYSLDVELQPRQGRVGRTPANARVDGGE